MNALSISLSFYLGPHGAMLLIPCCGTPWVSSSQKQVSNKVTPCMGPLLFGLVLQKILNAIDADDDCIHILYQAWYLNDGNLAGKKSAILRALSLLDSIGPSLGIFINMSKCELFCKGDISEFPPFMKFSHVPHLDLLGAPIGGYLFCGKYAASKRSEALKLLSRLVEVGASDPQVALILLCLCGSYCKLIHLARATPAKFSLRGTSAVQC